MPPKKKAPKKPATVCEKFVGFFLAGCFGGQIVYIGVAAVLAAITEMLLGSETATKLDSFFVHEASAVRPAIDGAQLAVRSFVCGAVLIGMFFFFVLAALFIGVGGLGYFYLSAHNGDVALFMKHRRDVVVLFLAVGFPIGWALSEVWNKIPYVGAWLSLPDVAHIVLGALAATAGSLWKLSDAAAAADKAAEKKKRKKSRGEALAASLADAKIGTKQINGETSNVTAGDVADAVSSALTSKTEKQAQWAACEENCYMKCARVVSGVAYGLLVRIGVNMLMKCLVNPFNADNPLMVSWLSGTRAAGRHATRATQPSQVGEDETVLTPTDVPTTEPTGQLGPMRHPLPYQFGHFFAYCLVVVCVLALTISRPSRRPPTRP